MTAFELQQLQECARRWASVDCDEADSAAALTLAEQGDWPTLQQHFGSMLEFGTAGLRGRVGPGPGCMNAALVRVATVAVAQFLKQQERPLDDRPVVLGYDARLSSRAFAVQAAGVLTAAGIAVRYFEAPVPTPLVAYALRWYRGSAGIVITASHNPRDDNGYKLYASNGIQIVSPADEQIAALMARAAAPRDIPFRAGVLDGMVDGACAVQSSVFDDYFSQLQRLRPSHAPRRDLAMVYTPLHGVGGDSVQRALSQAGFCNLAVVPEQVKPDGTFPTTPNPNPERPGVLDLARGQAERDGATLVLANDPDADRLAACARTPDGEVRALTGNQLGVLLTEYLLSADADPASGLVVRSIVSTPMVDVIASAYGASAETTLTGFKWLWNAALEITSTQRKHPVIAFEEALGYSIGDVVRDKDGVSAALVCAELAAALDASGSSLFAHLERLFRRFGLWVSVQLPVRREPPDGLGEIAQAFERLANSPPTAVCGRDVVGVTDYRSGAATRPRWLGAAPLLELAFSCGGRALVRPSGTEPLLKFYVDLVRPLTDSDDVSVSEGHLRDEANAVAQRLRELAGI